MAADFLDKFKKKISSLRDQLPLKKSSIDEDKDNEIASEDKTGKFTLSEELLDNEDTNPQFKQEELKEDLEFNVNGQEAVEDEEEDDEEEEEDDKLAKDKKRKQIIYGIVIATLIYVGYDEITKESAVEQKQAQEKIEKKSKKKKVVVQEVAKEKAPELVVQEVEPTAKVKVEKELPIETKEDIVENKVLNEEEPNFEEKVSEQEQEETQVETVEFEKIGQKENTMEIQEEVSNKTFDLDTQLNEIVKNVEKESKEKQILLEYIAPPNYENFGESLVYNCKGKHWACVDKKSHFQCMDNHNWSKQNEKEPECTNFKVLATPGDCRKLQLYNINLVKDIPDCK